MRRLFVTIALFVLTVFSRAEPATYTNPVYDGNMPDPTVLRYKGLYYAFGTTGPERVGGKIFTLLRSTNLVAWQKLGGALVPPSPDTNYEYWAPEITEAEGKFYLYYAMGIPRKEHFVNRVAVSSVPEGPYVDTGNVLVDCVSNRFTIDPYPFRDDDGKWYFFYACNFPTNQPGIHAGTGIMVDRLIDMTRLAGDCHVVVRARYDWTLYEAHRRMDVYNATFDWHTIEGPCVIKHDGKYYCIYSGSKWLTTNYGLDCVVADHPLGPYTGQSDRPRVLHGIPGHVRGPGHNDIVVGPDDQTKYFVYHAWNPEMTKRQLCIDKLYWNPDGPVCDGPTYTPQPAPMLKQYKYFAGGAYGSLGAEPNSTPVHIGYVGQDNGEARFSITNGESRSILIWNYRIQSRMNGSEWKTMTDDYPAAGEISHMDANSTNTITTPAPEGTAWRISIIYSKGLNYEQHPGSYGGDYEVDGPEVTE